jgi:hypothetical protein
MWRWVTRGLVVSFVALLAPALFAQTTFVGDVDSPDPSKPQSGVVYVRGWALDPHTISKIELWVDDQYQHNMIMSLPRVDIVNAFPDWPGIHNARPGFVTGFLASRFPNGNHTVEVRVYNTNGEVNFLGRRTIQINNSINQAPFGALDVPGGGSVANVSGAFPAVGWAADTDGIDRIEVLIDESVMQGALHGDMRPDVGGTFPDFSGAMYSGFVANIDSTRIQNGVHSLTVRAIDRKGMSSVIGSRMIQVINNDLFLKPFGYLEEPQRDATLYGTSCGPDEEPPVVSPPIRDVTSEHITPVKGWALDLGTRPDTGRVAYAELLVDGVPWISTDYCGVVAGRFANCYGLPRFDVARYYPTFPDAPLSGFLFTMDVGALMTLGVRPGPHNLMVRVGDREQTFAELPNRDGIPVWFQCVDENFDFPGFGVIDYPQNQDYVGGTITFRGWAVEDNEDVILVEVYIDGNFVGLAQHGYPRPDVADVYPHIDNAEKSGWQFVFDTNKLANSIHRVTVRTVDNSGDKNTIASADFYVANNNPQP